MIAGLFALGAGALWRRSFFTERQLPLLLPAQKVAALAGALAAFGYVLLAGFGVPAQRTLYMLLVVALALWLGRITSIVHVLCLALGVVVLLDPWAVLWAGFWLSFGAVASMLYATAGRTTAPLPESASRWRRMRHRGAGRAYAVCGDGGIGAFDDAAVLASVAGQPRGQCADHSCCQPGRHAFVLGEHLSASTLPDGSLLLAHVIRRRNTSLRLKA